MVNIISNLLDDAIIYKDLKRYSILSLINQLRDKNMSDIDIYKILLESGFGVKDLKQFFLEIDVKGIKVKSNTNSNESIDDALKLLKKGYGLNYVLNKLDLTKDRLEYELSLNGIDKETLKVAQLKLSKKLNKKGYSKEYILRLTGIYSDELSRDKFYLSSRVIKIGVKDLQSSGILKSLKNKKGIYIAKGYNKETLYIGKSNNLTSRLTISSHHVLNKIVEDIAYIIIYIVYKDKKAIEYEFEDRIDILYTDYLSMLERKMISKFKPIYNNTWQKKKTQT